MHTVNITEARARLSELVDQAAAGEDVVISRNGRPLVRITRLQDHPPAVRFGVLQGRVTIAEDFDAPLPDDVLGDVFCQPAAPGRPAR